jgi:predicted MPP superfamily phosphohydrolase
VALLWIRRVFLILPLCIGLYGLWNAEQIQVTRYSLPLNAPAWSGKRIVFLSDIHLGQIHGVGYSQRIVDMVNEQKPDIVFIGGDLYDGVKVPEKDIIAPFSKLVTTKGVYFVTGNHEEFSDGSHYIDAVKSVGMRVLANQKTVIDGVTLIGMNDSDSTNPKTFETLLALMNISSSSPTILLKHQPFQLDIAERYGISVQMSGHTHRAQLYPLSFITKAIYKGYDYGYGQYGNMRVYTTSGVGTWGPPGRVGTKSEIVVFDVE